MDFLVVFLAADGGRCLGIVSIRVGWLADDLGITIGGAEFTQAEFRKAAPEGVEIAPCSAGEAMGDVDAVVIHNCVSYQPRELSFTVPTFKYFHDVGPHLSREQWDALGSARPICCSPLQAERMGLEAELIPPAIPLERFRKAAENAQERSGAVAVGPWMNPAKNPQGAAEWAQGNGGIDFLGLGPFAPPGAYPVPYDELPAALARYKTYVHLPRVLEPFGRSTVEAWAAGLSVITNSLVGARYWITEEPDKLESASSDFWQLVLNG